MGTPSLGGTNFNVRSFGRLSYQKHAGSLHELHDRAVYGNARQVARLIENRREKWLGGRQFPEGIRHALAAARVIQSSV